MTNVRAALRPFIRMESVKLTTDPGKPLPWKWIAIGLAFAVVIGVGVYGWAQRWFTFL